MDRRVARRAWKKLAPDRVSSLLHPLAEAALSSACIPYGSVLPDKYFALARCQKSSTRRHS